MRISVYFSRQIDRRISFISVLILSRFWVKKLKSKHRKCGSTSEKLFVGKHPKSCLLFEFSHP
ncbi:hypothetical protein CLOSTASPAR_04545 [[Clostridium] asparagiforme DSM 15981]|uniref:Uncharacterized protein n=1 Tax=[Clostridium] asparagiforme DSM 15981 TaxID=518636 RepID=C0D5J9_9FIRM|nr:hypothetical protein CLOSTASPAR_04545 [[Clostridium] asparagiforme DSM 15981]